MANPCCMPQALAEGSVPAGSSPVLMRRIRRRHYTLTSPEFVATFGRSPQEALVLMPTPAGSEPATVAGRCSAWPVQQAIPRSVSTLPGSAILTSASAGLECPHANDITCIRVRRRSLAALDRSEAEIQGYEGGLSNALLSDYVRKHCRTRASFDHIHHNNDFTNPLMGQQLPYLRTRSGLEKFETITQDAERDLKSSPVNEKLRRGPSRDWIGPRKEEWRETKSDLRNHPASQRMLRSCTRDVLQCFETKAEDGASDLIHLEAPVRLVRQRTLDALQLLGSENRFTYPAVNQRLLRHRVRDSVDKLETESGYKNRPASEQLCRPARDRFEIPVAESGLRSARKSACTLHCAIPTRARSDSESSFASPQEALRNGPQHQTPAPRVAERAHSAQRATSSKGKARSSARGQGLAAERPERLRDLCQPAGAPAGYYATPFWPRRATAAAAREAGYH